MSLEDSNRRDNPAVIPKSARPYQITRSPARPPPSSGHRVRAAAAADSIVINPRGQTIHARSELGTFLRWRHRGKENHSNFGFQIKLKTLRTEHLSATYAAK